MRKNISQIPLFAIYKNTHSTTKYFAIYVQGQESEKRIREYFYFIDHQGMVINNKTIQLLLD